jgi:hypothetical protein
MPQERLTIVPVTLHPENNCVSPSTSSTISSSGFCTIKLANAEIAFYNGVEEHIIQTIMKELKNW